MISILLYDSDKEYAARLGFGLARAGKELEVEIVSASHMDRAFDSCKPGKREHYDFILTDCSLHGAVRQAYPEPYIIVLAEADRAATTGEDARTKTVYRYGPISRLLSLIREEFSLNSDKNWLSRSPDAAGARLICCFGLSGGCGASSVAIGLGREFAAYREKRTLYVSMECIESDMQCINDIGEQRPGDIGNVLYALFKKKPRNRDLFLESYLLRDRYGLERFYPSAGLNDAMLLSDKELEYYITALTNNSSFGLIIVDLGCFLSERNRQLASLCDSVVFVENMLSNNGKAEKTLDLVRKTWDIPGQKILVKNMIPDQNELIAEDSAESGETDTSRFRINLPGLLKKAAAPLPPEGSSPPSATTSWSEHPRNGKGDTPLHSPFLSSRKRFFPDDKKSNHGDKQKADNADCDTSEGDWLTARVEIPFDADSFRHSNEYDISMSGCFGSCLKELADILMT